VISADAPESVGERLPIVGGS